MSPRKESYDQRFLEEMRSILTQARKWRQQGLEVEERDMLQFIGGENAGIDQHQADDASAVYEQALAVTLRNTLAGTLTQIEHALRAMDEGIYGRCKTCGEWIDPARLRALPFADECIDCARKQSADFEPPTY